MIYTLIVCVGFSFGTCEKVIHEIYPSKDICEQAKIKTGAIPDLIFSTCKLSIEGKK